MSRQNIETCEWDPALCAAFGVPMTMLPEIRSSSEVKLGSIAAHLLKLIERETVGAAGPAAGFKSGPASVLIFLVRGCVLWWRGVERVEERERQSERE